MHNGLKASLPILFTALVILSSGCIGLDPTTFAKTIPMVQEFLNDHPNAEIIIVHYTETEAESIIDQIKEDCGKLSVEPKEYYFVNITDPSEGLVVRAWIDWKNQIIECVYKEGSIVDPGNCTSLYEAKCFSDHLYWFDSCGNREDKKEYCPLGCSNGRCVTGDICDVDKSYTEKPRCVCPDGYEMIVLYPRCVEAYTGAITGMPFAITEDVAERAIQIESGEVAISSDFTTDFGYRCPDTRPVYRCVKRHQCRSHAQAKCYKGHVYWFDSCGHVQEKKEYCSEGCDNGFCKGSRSCERMGGYCIYPNIACPADAKVCPDGTGVGRVPPACDFAPCPPVNLCELEPDPGHCEAAIPRYYFDNEDDTCKKFFWGGCGGVVPFKTLEGCQERCMGITPDLASDPATGMIHDYEPTTSTGSSPDVGTVSTVACREGHIRANYWCPGNGVCCMPERTRCSDSDGGINYYEKGTTCIGGGSSEIHCEVDKCLHRDCVGCPDQVIEYYCTDDTESGAAWGEIKHTVADCPGACVDGACVREEEKCRNEDYDCYLGDLPCCSGLVEVPLAHEDESGQCIAATCGSICRPCGNGICDENENRCSCPEDCEATCTDSDGGKDYYTAGFTKIGSDVGADSCCENYSCHAEGRYPELQEWYCENGEMKSLIYECPNECEDGACIEGRPDLIVESIEFEYSTSGPNESYRYTVYVKNIGDSNAEKSRVKVEIDPSQPQSINAGEYYVCTSGHTAPVPQNDLVPGDVLGPGQRERNFDYFNPVYSGNVTITAKADIYNEVDESNEENNELTKTFSIDTALIEIELCPNGCNNGTCYNSYESIEEFFALMDEKVESVYYQGQPASVVIENEMYMEQICFGTFTVSISSIVHEFSLPVHINESGCHNRGTIEQIKFTNIGEVIEITFP